MKDVVSVKIPCRVFPLYPAVSLNRELASLKHGSIK